MGPCLVKIALLFLERAINCTNTLCLEVVSKYSCGARFLLVTNRKESPLSPVHHSSDPPRCRIQPVLVLNPPGTRPLRTLDLHSFPCPT